MTLLSGDQTHSRVGAGTGIVVDSTKVHINSGQVVLTWQEPINQWNKNILAYRNRRSFKASGSGIIVNNLHVTESITGDGDAAKVLTENAINISGLTFSEQEIYERICSIDRYNNGEVALSNLTQSAGVEICTIDFAARQLGNIINVESELSFSAVDVVDLYIMLFVDDETSPRRVWHTTEFIQPR